MNGGNNNHKDGKEKTVRRRSYYWGHGKLGRCVIQLSKFLNHTLLLITKLKLI
jgi:hypothetical protein